jgi:hypothetical protein
MKKFIAFIVCTFKGCQWQDDIATSLGGERIKWQRCARCSARHFQSWGSQ